MFPTTIAPQTATLSRQATASVYDRLAVLRFPLIVGVIFIHAYDTTVDLADGTAGMTNGTWLSDLIRYLISQELARTAVPLFFLISGYLFFYRETFTIRAYAGKLRSRVKTLLVPFLFWNLLTLTLFGIAQALPLTAPLFSSKKTLIADYSALDYLSALGAGDMPIAYQFWFIRDLILLVLLSPAIYWPARLFPVPVLALLAIAWIAGWQPLLFPSIEAIFFFAVGSAAAIQGHGLAMLDRYGKILGGLFLLTLAADTYFAGSDSGLYVHKIDVVMGTACMLWLSGQVMTAERLKNVLLKLSAASFFVFAAHEPLLTLLRKLSFKTLQPENAAMALALYFANPIIVIVALVAISRLLRSTLPEFYRLITGGR